TGMVLSGARGLVVALLGAPFMLGSLTVLAVQMPADLINPPAATNSAPMAAAASFHGVLRYYDSSGWRPAIGLAFAQWNAAHVGVTFKPSNDPGRADVTIVSDQSALAHVRTREPPGPVAFASRIGVEPGERVTITLGHPPAYPYVPSGADVRLVVHEI